MQFYSVPIEFYSRTRIDHKISLKSWHLQMRQLRPREKSDLFKVTELVFVSELGWEPRTISFRADCPIVNWYIPNQLLIVYILLT